MSFKPGLVNMISRLVILAKSRDRILPPLLPLHEKKISRRPRDPNVNKMTEQTAPPILSTETNVFEDPTADIKPERDGRLSDEEIRDVYEIERTAREVIAGEWTRVALQFPDGMLGDAPRVYEALERELELLGKKKEKETSGTPTILKDVENKLETEILPPPPTTPSRIRLAILADTSYGSCCVDEIAAEHVAADVVIHYGRACLSPTARLPVIYVYTFHSLDLGSVIEAFEGNFEKGEKVIVMADLTYHSHIPALVQGLRERGWEGVRGTEVVHDPVAAIPNRKILWREGSEEGVEYKEEERLKEWKVWHVSEPPAALLLTLSSRIKELLIYPTTSSSSSTKKEVIRSNTSKTLARRYGLLTRLTTTPIIGILINTLSVSNYLSSTTTLRNLILAAGKKSYTFVVGKVNSAKMANFSEVGGWVVVGCWESSLIESKDFYAPVVTPFELALALQSDDERVWSGAWRGDFGVLEESAKSEAAKEAVGGSVPERIHQDEPQSTSKETEVDDEDSEEESAPPEFDLRTGRYVSHSRPMQATAIPRAQTSSSNPPQPTQSQVLARRAKLDVATVNGTVSPGAEYLRTQRTWTGLGSDFDRDGEDGDGKGDEVAATIEEGRSGVARGYVVGDSERS